MKRFILVGIHTGIGKTLSAAVICQALGYDYWKPVQSGIIDGTDSGTIRQLVSNPQVSVHPEAFVLTRPVSPHAAAASDHTYIDVEKLNVPVTGNHLLIETAGGLFSPLNELRTNFDLVQRFGFPVILISRNYLGSINHTLLTLNALYQRNINVHALVFSGNSNPESEEYILNYGKITTWTHIPEMEETPESVSNIADQIKPELERILK